MHDQGKGTIEIREKQCTEEEAALLLAAPDPARH
jgi:hypothetical protein